jgi:hypothetical protein
MRGVSRRWRYAGDKRGGAWVRIRHPKGVPATLETVSDWVGLFESLVVTNPPLAEAVTKEIIVRYCTYRSQAFGLRHRLHRLENPELYSAEEDE